MIYYLTTWSTASYHVKVDRTAFYLIHTARLSMIYRTLNIKAYESDQNMSLSALGFVDAVESVIQIPLTLFAFHISLIAVAIWFASVVLSTKRISACVLYAMFNIYYKDKIDKIMEISTDSINKCLASQHTKHTCICVPGSRWVKYSHCACFSKHRFIAPIVERYTTISYTAIGTTKTDFVSSYYNIFAI